MYYDSLTGVYTDANGNILYTQLSGTNENGNALFIEPVGTDDPSPIWNFPSYFSQEYIQGYNPSDPINSQFSSDFENIYADPDFFNQKTLYYYPYTSSYQTGLNTDSLSIARGLITGANIGGDQSWVENNINIADNGGLQNLPQGGFGSGF